MKKYLLLVLVGLFCFAGLTEAQAKAVKLGRGSNASNGRGTLLITDDQKKPPKPPVICPANCSSCDSAGKCTACQNKYYLNGSQCVRECIILDNRSF